MANFRIRNTSILFIFFCNFLIISAEAGKVKGHIPLPVAKNKPIPFGKYTRKISGKVGPSPALVAGVWLTQKNSTHKASTKTTSLGQKNYQFSKRLLIVQKGTKVFFPNFDIDYHNIYSLSKEARFDLGRYKPNDKVTPSYQFNQTGFIDLHCEIHEHMKATVIVVDTPYYVLSDAAGNFFFPQNIPSGDYIIHAQLNKKMKWSQPISVPEKGTAVIQIAEQ